ATPIQTHDVKRVLAYIDTNHRDCRIEFVGHGVLLVFGAPCQLPLLAGPEHGRTIPLAVIPPTRPWDGSGVSSLHCMNDPQPEGHMASPIGRRKFLATLGGVAAWPLAARAQQRTMPVIGYLNEGAAEPGTNFLAEFRKGLGDAGYFEGRNVAIEYRWAYNQGERLPELAADLIRRGVNVIVTPGSGAAARAAKAATTTIPIVFSIVADPVQTGLVASLNRPGGNATGIGYMSTDIATKRLGLLHELKPHASHFAMLVNPRGDDAERLTKELKEAASAAGWEMEVLTA